MKLKPPKKKCCRNPDVKNEGFVEVPKGRCWEYHCYARDRTWDEIEYPDGQIEVNPNGDY